MNNTTSGPAGFDFVNTNGRSAEPSTSMKKPRGIRKSSDFATSDLHMHSSSIILSGTGAFGDPVRRVRRNGLWWLFAAMFSLVGFAPNLAHAQGSSCINPASCPITWSTWQPRPELTLTISVPGIPPSSFIAEYAVRNCDSSNWELHPHSLRKNTAAGANPLLTRLDYLYDNGMADSAWKIVGQAFLNAGRQLMAHEFQNTVVANNTPSSRYTCSNAAPACQSEQGVKYRINSNFCNELMFVMDSNDPGYDPNEHTFQRGKGRLMWYWIDVWPRLCNSYQNEFCVDGAYNYNRVCESVFTTGDEDCSGQSNFQPPPGWFIEKRSNGRLNLFVP